MKNSTLIFRSLGVIILLAGTAHLFTFATKKDAPNFEDNRSSFPESEVIYDSLEHTHSPNPEEQLESYSGQAYDADYNEETDYIIDKWEVTYNSTTFTGSIVYDIRKEGEVFHAYTYQYKDEHGNAQPAEGAKILVIKSFDGYTGKGTYQIEYEGEKYEIECQIDMVDENTFALSYAYYGYEDTETWRRQ